MTSSSGEHPKGHRSRLLDDVWEAMDKKDYLRVTDTLALSDVWVRPKSVSTVPAPRPKNAKTPPRPSQFVVEVLFDMIVCGLHWKKREVSYRIDVTDLLKMFYIAAQTEASVRPHGKHEDFEEWFGRMMKEYIVATTPDNATNRVGLCQYLLEKDVVTFFPCGVDAALSVFFRKSCCHTYKAEKQEGEVKLNNPGLVKCSTRGAFEYVIESRIFIEPTTREESEEMPESQAI